MLIIKVGGSVFAPKKSNVFYSDYLSALSSLLSEYYKGQILLVHGTGNIGHDFVNTYGVNKTTFEIFKNVRKKFYKKMEDIFYGYTRNSAQDILEESKKIILGKGNYIVGGDINSDTLDIISSDQVFGFFCKKYKDCHKIILTDVPGVLDEYGETIPKLNITMINNLNFWDKSGDVTNGMKGKLLSIEKSLSIGNSGIWIIDGKNLKNLMNILISGKGEGTYIYKDGNEM
ncbi:MAG: hypothetical protein PHN31_06680 [Candidatus Gracilibacteria bacterium]|nr:hypothetical protein [Candidatus Gracilibacteria bacterium]